MPDSGYPTDEELDRIAAWPFDDPAGWMAYIRSVGNYWPDDDGWWFEEAGTDPFSDRPIRILNISTGGWSGNEDIIAAMRRNFLLWARTWQEHRRGGHYVFHLPEANA